MKIALITGASSGIGMEFAKQMDEKFTNIDEFWLVARSEDKLRKLEESLLHKCRVFPMDVTDSKKLKELEDIVKESKAEICFLIGCAGYGMIGPFEDADLSETLGMIRLNCEALTEITHRLLPYLGKNARIIHMSSSAAFIPQPDFAVYTASKAYVLSFCRALQKELKGRGISVTAVCPGPVDTPFFNRAEKDGFTLAIKKVSLETPQRVVRLALKDAYKRKSKSVCGMPMRIFEVSAKLLPHNIFMEGLVFLKKLGVGKLAEDQQL